MGYVTGASDARFDDDVLHQLDRFHGSDFEVVDTTGLVNGPKRWLRHRRESLLRTAATRL